MLLLVLACTYVICSSTSICTVSISTWRSRSCWSTCTTRSTVISIADWVLGRRSLGLRWNRSIEYKQVTCCSTWASGLIKRRRTRWQEWVGGLWVEWHFVNYGLFHNTQATARTSWRACCSTSVAISRGRSLNPCLTCGTWIAPIECSLCACESMC